MRHFRAREVLEDMLKFSTSCNSCCRDGSITRAAAEAALAAAADTAEAAAAAAVAAAEAAEGFPLPLGVTPLGEVVPDGASRRDLQKRVGGRTKLLIASQSLTSHERALFTGASELSQIVSLKNVQKHS